jgi:hypothetical protein
MQNDVVLPSLHMRDSQCIHYAGGLYILQYDYIKKIGNQLNASGLLFRPNILRGTKSKAGQRARRRLARMLGGWIAPIRRSIMIVMLRFRLQH